MWARRNIRRKRNTAELNNPNWRIEVIKVKEPANYAYLVSRASLWGIKLKCVWKTSKIINFACPRTPNMRIFRKLDGPCVSSRLDSGTLWINFPGKLWNISAEWRTFTPPTVLTYVFYCTKVSKKMYHLHSNIANSVICNLTSV